MARQVFEIEIRDEARSFHLSHVRLRRTAKKILQNLGWKKAGLSIYLVSDRKIQTLNKRYLKHDRPTDVIAFGNDEIASSAFRPLRNDTPLRAKRSNLQVNFLGDIVISLETAKRAARDHQTSFWYEVCLYLCHGILHILGYRDKTAAAKKKMWKKQEQILKKMVFGLES